jgi:hypothetical protein
MIIATRYLSEGYDFKTYGYLNTEQAAKVYMIREMDIKTKTYEIYNQNVPHIDSIMTNVTENRHLITQVNKSGILNLETIISLLRDFRIAVDMCSKGAAEDVEILIECSQKSLQGSNYRSLINEEKRGPGRPPKKKEEDMNKGKPSKGKGMMKLEQFFSKKQ